MNNETTRTRNQGTEVTNTTEFRKPGEARINAIRRVVEQKTYAKVDGVMVDLLTASAIVKVFDAISMSNKIKFMALPVDRMANIAFSLLK